MKDIRQNAANVDIPLPYHFVNNEETCLHLTLLKVNRINNQHEICHSAHESEFGFLFKTCDKKYKIMITSVCPLCLHKKRHLCPVTVHSHWFSLSGK